MKEHAMPPTRLETIHQLARFAKLVAYAAGFKLHFRPAGKKLVAALNSENEDIRGIAGMFLVQI